MGPDKYARANLLLLVDLNSRSQKTEFRIVRKVSCRAEFRVAIYVCCGHFVVTGALPNQTALIPQP